MVREFTSKYFPVWYLATHPEKKVILSSYETNYAISWGQKARDVFDECVPEYFGTKRRGKHTGKLGNIKVGTCIVLV